MSENESNAYQLIPCPFCGGTKMWIGTIAECEMQDKNHTKIILIMNSIVNTMLLFVIIWKADAVRQLVEAQGQLKML